LITWILRVILVRAAPITALFISRDALNFGIVEMLVAATLIAALASWLRFGRCAGLTRADSIDRCG
jgi:hypothetical protein